MFDRKDIAQLKKDIVLDVELLNSRFKLHTRWGVFMDQLVLHWLGSVTREKFIW